MLTVRNTDLRASKCFFSFCHTSRSRIGTFCIENANGQFLRSCGAFPGGFFAKPARANYVPLTASLALPIARRSAARAARLMPCQAACGGALQANRASDWLACDKNACPI